MDGARRSSQRGGRQWLPVGSGRYTPVLAVGGAVRLAFVLAAAGCVRGVASQAAPATAAPGAAHHAAPDGAATGDGTRERPWDLATALAGAGGRIGPGDTVWLAGGTYRGRFRTALEGAPGAPIVFRQRPHERATIDGTLRADGAHLVFWGFEITQSDPADSGFYGLQANASHSRFINLVIHDVGTQGVSFWTPGVDSELYGCIVYNNGTHENLDHGVYVHNDSGTKRLRDNVFFANYARGIQVYASRRNAVIRDVVVEGNTSFNNGVTSARSTRVNLLVNAQVPTRAIVATGNLLYFSPGAGGINVRLGSEAAANNRSVTLRGTYAGGGDIGLQMELPWDTAEVADNVFLGSRTALRTGGAGLSARYAWRANRYANDPAAAAWRHGGRDVDWAGWRAVTGLGSTDSLVAPPGSTVVFIRPNAYEAGRATIVVYNWGRDPVARAALAGVLAPGDRYEVRNVQDLFGRPVATGTYAGEPIAIPMAGVEPPAPVRAAPARAPRTGPEFDVFILTRAEP